MVYGAVSGGEGEGEVAVFAGFLVGVEPAAAVEVLQDAIGGVKDDQAPGGIRDSVALGGREARHEKPLSVGFQVEDSRRVRDENAYSHALCM
jgi:hypothetical protein